MSEFDLTTTKGKNETAKFLLSVAQEVVETYIGKTNLTYDDLMCAAHDGIIYTLDNFKGDPENLVPYARYHIRFKILDFIKEHAHTVKVPIQFQREERKRYGKNFKNRSCSGDTILGEGSGSITMFDLLSPVEDVEVEDSSALLEELRSLLIAKHPERERDIKVFTDLFGLDGKGVMIGEDVAKKYGVSKSSIVRIKNLMINLIKDDRDCMELIGEIHEIANR